jgi:hypothetical protein
LKSKKRSRITNGKQSQLDEPPIFFLDRTFGRNELAAMLRSAGFLLVTIYEEFGEADGKISDPTFILDCGYKGRVVLTGDQDMVYTYAKEIVDAKIAVFATTDNNDGPKVWGPLILAAKDDILRELRRREMPFTASISREGRVTLVRVHDGTEWKTIPIRKKNLSNFERKRKK